MMHRNVVLEDEYGDHHRGVERQTQSDLPNTVTVNGTCWAWDLWWADGWSLHESGEWE